MYAFKYDSLGKEQIRLLRFLPQPSQSENAPMRIRIKTCKIDELPDYVAVSYEWGQGSPNRLIALNDRDFWIRDNLWWCLVNLRKQKLGEWFWIDCICINQNNFSERDAQVQLMGQIYTKAMCVGSWVGKSGREERRQAAEFGLPPLRGIASLRKEVPGGVTNICSRSYWSRMWIAQEFLLAQRVFLLCGRCCVTWEEFKMSYDSSQSRNMADSTILPFIPLRDKHAFERGLTLEQLLERYCQSQCRDPRDRVFSILTLLNPRERTQLGQYFPNYRLSVEDVLIITMIHLKQAIVDERGDFLLNTFGVFGDPARARVYKAVLQMDLSRYSKHRAGRSFHQAAISSITPWRSRQGKRDEGATSDRGNRCRGEARIGHPKRSLAEGDTIIELSNRATDDLVRVHSYDLCEDHTTDLGASVDSLTASIESSIDDEDPLSRSFVDLKWHIRTITGPQTTKEALIMSLQRIAPVYKIYWRLHRLGRRMRLGIAFLQSARSSLLSEMRHLPDHVAALPDLWLLTFESMVEALAFSVHFFQVEIVPFVQRTLQIIRFGDLSRYARYVVFFTCAMAFISFLVAQHLLYAIGRLAGLHVEPALI